MTAVHTDVHLKAQQLRRGTGIEIVHEATEPAATETSPAFVML